MPDWTDRNRKDTVRVYMVSPTNLNEVIGELNGFEPEGSTLTWGYDTDTRTSGSIKAVDSNWVKNSRLRIVHEVREWGFREELGTYVVTDVSADRNKGAWETTYTLQSTLYTMSEDYLPNHVSIAKGGLGIDFMKTIMSQAGVPYAVMPTANHWRSEKSVVYELGDSRLSDLMDACKRSNNRVDVDSHGRVVISGYVIPHNISPSWSIDLKARGYDPLDGITYTTNEFSQVNRVVVIQKTGSDEKQVESVGYADATGRVSKQARGYYVTHVEDVDDLPRETNAAASDRARSLLSNSTELIDEFQMTVPYAPYRIGQTVTVNMPDGPLKGRLKCLVKSIDPLDLGRAFTEKLTLKVV